MLIFKNSKQFQYIGMIEFFQDDGLGHFEWTVILFFDHFDGSDDLWFVLLVA